MRFQKTSKGFYFFFPLCVGGDDHILFFPENVKVCEMKIMKF